MKVKLNTFNPKVGLERGRSLIIEILWYLVKIIFFLSALPWPMFLKNGILRVFGAKIGNGVIIKPRVNIHFPWKLQIGNYVWLGEEVFILNFEEVIIEDNVCISQRAFICGGNHDYKDESFRYRNGPILIREGAWVGAQTFVGPNIEIARFCVITAGSVVTKDTPSKMICTGNPCVPIKPRWDEE